MRPELVMNFPQPRQPSETALDHLAARKQRDASLGSLGLGQAHLFQSAAAASAGSSPVCP